MHNQDRFWTRLGGLGIVYSALFVAVNVLFGSQPGTSAGGMSVIHFYRAHKASEIAGVFALAIGVVAFSFFVASLRRRLARTEDDSLLATAVTAGGAIYVTGLLVMAALQVALIDAANNRMIGAAQTLNVLSNDLWVPVVAGLSVLTLASGVTALRGTALPTWLGWASVGLGILALAGPVGGIAFLLAPVWTLVVGIVLMRGPARRPVEAGAGVPRFSPSNG
jgi:hypothetical protein